MNGNNKNKTKMKQLTNVTGILLFFVIVLCSCDNPDKGENNPPETYIFQYVKSDNGNFILNTGICIEWGFKHNMYSTDYIYPYGNSIDSSFEYIKNIKTAEYFRADSVLHTSRIKYICDSILAIQERRKRLTDSITTLNKL